MHPPNRSPNHHSTVCLIYIVKTKWLLTLAAREIESPKPIFADGNTNFQTLEAGHVCNVFCKHFGLGPFPAIVNDEDGEADMDISKKVSWEV